MSEVRALGDVHTVERTCERYTPVYYAAVSGDFNPIHHDVELARGAGLPGTILQGLCTLGWLADACVGALGGDPTRLLHLEARFARPVRAGDTVRFEVRCAGVEDGRARLEITARNAQGEEVLKHAAAVGLLAGPGGAP